MRIVCGKPSLEVGEHTILGNGDWRRSPLPPLRTFPPYRVVSQVPPSDGLWVLWYGQMFPLKSLNGRLFRFTRSLCCR